MLIGSSPSLPWLNTAAGNGPLPFGNSQKPANCLPSLRYDVRHCSYGARFRTVAGIVHLPDRGCRRAANVSPYSPQIARSTARTRSGVRVRFSLRSRPSTCPSPGTPGYACPRNAGRRSGGKGPAAGKPVRPCPQAHKCPGPRLPHGAARAWAELIAAHRRDIVVWRPTCS